MQPLEVVVVEGEEERHPREARHVAGVGEGVEAGGVAEEEEEEEEKGEGKVGEVEVGEEDEAEDEVDEVEDLLVSRMWLISGKKRTRQVGPTTIARLELPRRWPRRWDEAG